MFQGQQAAPPHLPLNIGKQSAGTYSKEFRLHPLISQLLLYEREPHKGVLRAADASGRFKAYLKGDMGKRTMLSIVTALLSKLVLR